MTIETRARRAGAAARAAAGEGMDLMTASTQLPQEFDQRQRQRRNRLISAAAVAAILVAGAAIAVPLLAEDPAPPASTSTETASAAGLTVVVPDGWSVDESFNTNDLAVVGDGDAWTSIQSLTRVWDPATQSFAAAPSDFGAWLRSNPSYEVVGEKSVEVAGQPTTTFTVTPTNRDGTAQTPLFEIPVPGFNPADAEYPGAENEVWDLNGGETGYLTPVTVDGRLVLVGSAQLSAAELADYEAMLASATT